MSSNDRLMIASNDKVEDGVASGAKETKHTVALEPHGSDDDFDEDLFSPAPLQLDLYEQWGITPFINDGAD